MRLQPQLIPAADHYWSTLVRNDSEAAYGVVARVIDAGVSPADALAGIVVHTQQKIGDSWAANHWTVGQEHAATAISEEVVTRVGDLLPAPDPERAPLLVACAEREFHSLAAQVVAVSMRSWGWPTDYLGPDTRRDRLQERLRSGRPAAVLVSASLSSSLTRVARQIADVTATGTPVIVGRRGLRRGRCPGEPAGRQRVRRLARGGPAATGQVRHNMPPTDHSGRGFRDGLLGDADAKARHRRGAS